MQAECGVFALSNDLSFPAGSMLTVERVGAVAYDNMGDRLDTSTSHNIGPCSVVGSSGRVDWEQDGSARWVGTVDVQAPPEADVMVTDRVHLPNGEYGVIVTPPQRPRNPFTGWTPFIQFTMSTPGYTPLHDGEGG